jgi:hypothetical protein
MTGESGLFNSSGRMTIGRSRRVRPCESRYTLIAGVVWVIRGSIREDPQAIAVNVDCPKAQSATSMSAGRYVRMPGV